jgi:hypothetical protein
MLQICVIEDRMIVLGDEEEIELFLQELRKELSLEIFYSGRCG